MCIRDRCVGVSDWSGIVLRNSSLAHIANPEYEGFGDDSLLNNSLKCGGRKWEWYCNYMHTLYFTRTEGALISHSRFDDAMWGSALDLTGAYNTRVESCQFSNIRQAVVYHANGGYTREGNNTVMTDIVAVNCSTIAVIGSPYFYLSNLNASGVRWGFDLSGGSVAELWNVTLSLGGETPSATGSNMSTALILADSGNQLLLSRSVVHFEPDSSGCSVVLLDSYGTSFDVAVVVITESDVTADQGLDYIVEYSNPQSRSCAAAQSIVIQDSRIPSPRNKADLSWRGDCSGVLTLTNNTNSSQQYQLHVH
eukprot:TRINITY_DN14435_c0_g1_i3.p1 TRINITY_DN14435_c0_g1~~TRINITY_DN14435_c0_g1_i3.p1  ORF type:complete len:309 (+),score=73.54 TRINITY_DN14435_c0_g1_i3:134-1060(+)